MATQLKHSDFAYTPPRSIVRVAFQTAPVLPGVTSAVAALPAAVREATLDELATNETQIVAMTKAVVAKAGELLSPRMYRAFLRWGEGAILALTESNEDDCEQRSKIVGEALRHLAATDAQNDQDGLLKAYLMAIEVADAPAFGPLKGDHASGYSVDKLTIGFAGDVAFLSPLTARIDELSAAAWAASGSTFAYSASFGEAMAAVFHGAAERTGPLKLDGYNPFLRGPLIRWQRAYNRYDAAAVELAAFDRDVHTPAAERCTALAAKVDQGDTGQAAALDAAGDELDVAQERYDDLCSARYDALAELLRIPAPGPAELATKLRLFSSDYGWTGGDEQKAAGEQMAIDARRFGRVGPFIEIDHDILASFDSFRSGLDALYRLPDNATEAQEQECFAVMDPAADGIANSRATTIEGVLAKLRYGFHGLGDRRFERGAILAPTDPTFLSKVGLGDLSERSIWSAIEDLARIAGVSLAEQAA